MPSINETILNELLLQQIRVERLNENQRRLIESRLGLLFDEIEAHIRLQRVDPTAVATERAQIRRLNQLIDDIQALVDEALLGNEGLYPELVEDQLDVADAEQDRTITLLNAAIGVALLTRRVSSERLRNIVEEAPFPNDQRANVFRGEAREWVKQAASDLPRRLRGAWLGSLQQNPTLNDMIQRMRGTRPQGFKDGVAHLTNRQLNAFYRTWSSSVQNHMRLELYQANHDVVRVVRDVATFDDKTAKVSIARHGNRYQLPDLRPIRRLDGRLSHPYLGGLPYHIGERNIYVPELARLRDIQGERKRQRLAQLNDEQRAALDGTIPQNTTFQSWLNRQPRAEQRELLGPTVYQLWQSGRLSARDLIRSTTGRPLTVRELTEQYGGGRLSQKLSL